MRRLLYNGGMVVTGIGQCSLDYLSLVDTYPPVDTKEEVLEWHEQGMSFTEGISMDL